MSSAKQFGFAVVELLMVGITIVVVAGGITFVVTQNVEQDPTLDSNATDENVGSEDINEPSTETSGVKVAERDSERRTHLKIVQTDLEAYFADAEQYPSAGDFANPVWRIGNLYSEPNNELAYTTHGITYNVRPNTCDNDSLPCTTYDLSVDLEVDGLGEEDLDSNTADALAQSLN